MQRRMRTCAAFISAAAAATKAPDTSPRRPVRTGCFRWPGKEGSPFKVAREGAFPSQEIAWAACGGRAEHKSTGT
jgi:hypothetical protein